MDDKNYGSVTYYIPDATYSDHAATIIGWNDNYPKENFKYQPEHDGTWLEKNMTATRSCGGSPMKPT